MSNFGLDASFLNKKLDLSFDIYKRNTQGMFTPSAQLPAVLGTSSPQGNNANLSTKGWEVTIGYKNSLSNGLNYSVEVVMSDATSKITKYDNPTGSLGDHYVGENLGEIWGFVTDGFFATDAEAAAYKQNEVVGHALKAGDIKFKDLNGDNNITTGAGTLANPGDRKVIGNATPRYSYGLRGYAEFKGFDIALFFQGYAKAAFYPSSSFFLKQYGNEWAVPQNINKDYWTPTNTNAYFPTPRLDGYEVTTTQSHFLQNGAYLRLKQLTLGYTIQNLNNRIGLEKVRIYFAGNNLFVASKALKIFDPEIASANGYPLTRALSIGVEVTF